MNFTHVGEDGALEATCSITSDDAAEGSVVVSYRLEGSVDWTTREIYLRGVAWIDQGNFVYMRQFFGTLSEDYRTIVGGRSSDYTPENLYSRNGANETEWSMWAL
jgi:hypothetical protein